MSNLTLRHSIVTVATVLSLFGGAVAIRAAAGWTASSGPLVQPPNAAALVDQLKNERSHAEALANELGQVVARAQELRTALEAAQAKAAVDAQSATRLAAQLGAAEKEPRAECDQEAGGQGEPDAGMARGDELVPL